MRPKIKDRVAWQQAELLMQPTLIRLLDNIRKQLDESVWKGTYHNIQTPYPGYRLDLEYNGQTVSVDIWELCYQICFSNYRPTHAQLETLEVEIDTTLIDEEAQDVDWMRLDAKTQEIVNQLFANLPNEVSLEVDG